MPSTCTFCADSACFSDAGCKKKKGGWIKLKFQKYCPVLTVCLFRITKTRDMPSTCTFCADSACFSNAGCQKKGHLKKSEIPKILPGAGFLFFSQSKKWLKVCSRANTFCILKNMTCTTKIDSPQQTACDAPVLQLVVVAYSKTLYIRNNATCWTANIANKFKYASVSYTHLTLPTKA